MVPMPIQPTFNYQPVRPTQDQRVNRARNAAVTTAVIGGVVLAVFVGGAVAYRIKHPKRKSHVNLTGGTGIPSYGTDTHGNEQYWTPAPLVTRLGEAMKGRKFTGWDYSKAENAWQELAELLTDDMVRAVYEMYNQTYGREDVEYPTLTLKIKGETGWLWGSHKYDALDRLEKMNLL